MNTAAYRSNIRKLIFMSVLVAAAAAAYMLTDVNFGNEKLFHYAMKIRTPKLIVMLITAFAIGGASIVFQSIISNTIVTPCLLGMNSLYTLIHTAVVFFAGSGSILAVNANAAFAVDLILMSITATVIYSYLFKKTNHNVLYVLLIGTVLTSFFSSIQNTLTRVMDPNEYDSLLATLVASFSNVNSEIILFSLIVLAAVIFVLRKDLALLNVLTLGKNQAINLGAGETTSTHGNESSFETIVEKNPDYIFVMDRDAAIGTEGAQLAQDIVENELIMGTDAYKNGHIVYLEHPAVWYTAEGGINALNIMLEDLETSLLAE